MRADVLLAPEVDQVLDELPEAGQIGPRRLILKQAREVGIERAFSEPIAYAREKAAFAALSSAYHDSHYTRYVQLATALLTRLQRENAPQLWSEVQGRVGECLLRNSEATSTDLEAAIEANEAVLDTVNAKIRPDLWATAQHNLGEAYRRRVEGDLADNKEQAIWHLEQALPVYMALDPSSALLAETENSLGDAYRSRLKGDSNRNAETAVQHLRSAQRIFMALGLVDKLAITERNLGLALAARRRGEAPLADLVQSIQHLSAALETFGRQGNSLEQARTHGSLGFNYLQIGQQGGTSDAYIHAISHLETATNEELHHADPYEWAGFMANLGAAWVVGNPGQSESLERGVICFTKALEVWTLERFPRERRGAASNLGWTLASLERWQAALDALLEAITAEEQAFGAAYTEAGRLGILGEADEVHALAAYALLQLGRPGDALILLDAGRARLLAEAMVGSSVLHGPAGDRLQAARVRVRELEETARLPSDDQRRPPEGPLSDQLRKARAEQQLAALAAVAGSRPPLGRSLPELLEATPRGGAAVALCITSLGSVGFVLPHGIDTLADEHLLYLPRVTTETLRRLTVGERSNPKGWLMQSRPIDLATDELDRQDALEEFAEATDVFTGRLWDEFMGPITQSLSKAGVQPGAHVVLVPGAELGSLPLHAAWTEKDGGARDWFLDSYEVTYAPSLAVLAASQERMAALDRKPPRLLALVNPTGDLSGTEAEGDALQSLLPSESVTVLKRKEATQANLIAELPRNTLLHLACHGRYDWDDAAASEVRLADGPLTLAEIVTECDLRRVRLVTLSACDSGLNDFTLVTNEYLGLPAALMEAGTPGVLATLWKVPDVATGYLMEYFYRLTLMEGLSPARALRQAQRFLRDATAADLQLPSEDPTTRPFESAFHWAAFHFTGA